MSRQEPRQSEAPVDASPYIWRPALSRIRSIVFAIERFSDLLFTSRWNPIYKSGTIAVAALAILIISGTYILCFYDIAAPYESVRHLQQSIWLGELMRNAHRISSDVCLIFALLHLVQVLVRGKTFGPRRIAWWSGFFLLALIFLTAWTGFVLVWDVFGQRIALLGAEILQVFPFLRDTLAQAFDGSTPLLESFFFMNLFLHVALPVGLIGGLWIHTSRLTRPMWFPKRAALIGTSIAIIATSLITPLPLPPQADLLAILGEIPSDWWYAVWFLPLPFLGGGGFLLLILLLLLFGLSVPLWLKPRGSYIRELSTVDAERCSGCTQCVRDCPYQAIRMVPRPDGRRLLAEVNPNFCVSCGVCVASCDDEAIGPLDRRSTEELTRFNTFLTLQGNEGNQTIGIILCARNRSVLSRLKGYELPPPFAVDCVGALHNNLIVRALEAYSGLLILGCPQEGCENRVGPSVCEERLERKRVPFLPKQIDRNRIGFASLSDMDAPTIATLYQGLQEKLTGKPQSSSKRWRLLTLLRAPIAALFAGAFLYGIARMSSIPLGTAPTDGILRVSVRLRGLGEKVCRELTPEEKAKRPLHMQTPECEIERMPYELRIQLNGQELARRTFTHLGIRGDSPLFVHEDISLPPARYQAEISILPLGSDSDSAERLTYSGELDIAAGEIHLIAREGRGGAGLQLWRSEES